MMNDRSLDDMTDEIAKFRHAAERLRTLPPEYPVSAFFTASELADMCEDYANRIETGDFGDDDDESPEEATATAAAAKKVLELMRRHNIRSLGELFEEAKEDDKVDRSGLN